MSRDDFHILNEEHWAEIQDRREFCSDSDRLASMLARLQPRIVIFQGAPKLVDDGQLGQANPELTELVIVHPEAKQYGQAISLPGVRVTLWSCVQELLGCWSSGMGCWGVLYQVADRENQLTGLEWMELSRRSTPEALAIFQDCYDQHKYHELISTASSPSSDWFTRVSTGDRTRQLWTQRCRPERLARPSVGLVDGHLSLTLPDGQTARLTVTQALSFSETVSDFLKHNWGEFAQGTRLKMLNLRGRWARIVVTSNLPFWQSAEAGYWEPQTYDVFDDFISHRTTFLDIGGWIGLTSLYGAQLASRTIAFEPDPLAHQEFSDNLRVNRDFEWSSRLELRKLAMSNKVGTIRLGASGGGGDSMSSILLADPGLSWEVETTTLKSVINEENLEKEPLFLKIDIEGAEYSVVPSMGASLKTLNSDILLSLHPQLLWESLTRRWRGLGVAGKILRRLTFVWKHFRLIKSLPHKNLYQVGGGRFKLNPNLFMALVFVQFPSEIVATNREWSPGHPAKSI